MYTNQSHPLIGHRERSAYPLMTYNYTDAYATDYIYI